MKHARDVSWSHVHLSHAKEVRLNITSTMQDKILCPALPCPALPCPALPCPALPCPALPCPALTFTISTAEVDYMA